MKRNFYQALKDSDEVQVAVTLGPDGRFRPSLIVCYTHEPDQMFGPPGDPTFDSFEEAKTWCDKEVVPKLAKMFGEGTDVPLPDPKQFD